MFFRFLLIVSVLLARMEDVSANMRRLDSWPNHMAPVNINCQDSWLKYPSWDLDCIVPAKIPWNEFIIYGVLLITVILFRIFIGFIYDIIWRHLTKDKSGRDDGSDEDYYRVTTAKPLGKHENKLNIGYHEAPRGPWAEKRDKLKNIRIPPGRVRDTLANFRAYQNAIVNSDKHQEDKKHVPPSLLIFLKASERPTGFSEDEARPSQNRQYSPCTFVSSTLIPRLAKSPFIQYPSGWLGCIIDRQSFYRTCD
ncbi:uncharacterized protein LOC143804570 isoform X3 [Ranitomeya variabilis]|uniref:uncharacterized protein LOC143804570 isoform X3 n=1 Tax=Ranitomeya variabilis TaxID=490064 RepID=UPI004056E19D